ncbi:flippase activity-associated protein Agl23 [Haloferula sp. A504]|uniref:flippase activity-associated protein Agl23 n=1 Tax=Haloferula sp. A504 TaxID=3373601 RepID=UPI0031C5943C|nr:TIGR03663 family protein [Verrucomicrobiaceae bacterium E54]
MKRSVLIACWVAVAFVAVFLRWNDLAARPFHADEATGARITAHRVESGNYVFDPKHYHGPTLSGAAMVVARITGMKSWAEFEKAPLRAVPALAGCLLVLVPLLGRRRFGDAPMLIAALALATSPLLVYYSRMFIHEMLLGLFGVLALFQIACTKRWWLAGIWVGLMFATKASFAFSIASWGAAGGLLYLLSPRGPDKVMPAELVRRYWRTALLAAGLAVLTSLAFYTNGFTRWQGAVDAVKSYFIYDLVEGHDKPAAYFVDLLLWPRKLGGSWWFETPVALFAAAALVLSFVSRSMEPATRLAVRFLALSAVFHLAIYSAIAYKTPWLMVLPWAHVCLLAGFVATAVPRGNKVLAGVVGLVISAGFASQFLQSRQATGRLASDERNPYAYVPTSDDIESLVPWLDALDEALPERSIEPLGVVGSDYWPLPWYLRGYGKVGYWPEAPDNISRLPVVIAIDDLTVMLAGSHVPVPKGLRADTPMTVWVRGDFWDASLDAPPE